MTLKAANGVSLAASDQALEQRGRAILQQLSGLPLPQAIELLGSTLANLLSAGQAQNIDPAEVLLDLSQRIYLACRAERVRALEAKLALQNTTSPKVILPS